MLASTVQFSRYGRIRSQLPPRHRLTAGRSVQDRPEKKCFHSLRTQQRTYGHPIRSRPFPAPRGAVLDTTIESCDRTNQRSTLELLPQNIRLRNRYGPDRAPSKRHCLTGQVLLRKEVIQPHLPVRLPCYDFVPIADPTFDGSLLQVGWATGFGCYRLS